LINMTLYFQDCGHDVYPPLVSAYAAASAGCAPSTCLHAVSDP